NKNLVSTVSSMILFRINELLVIKHFGGLKFIFPLAAPLQEINTSGFSVLYTENFPIMPLAPKTSYPSVVIFFVGNPLPYTIFTISSNLHSTQSFLIMLLLRFGLIRI